MQLLIVGIAAIVGLGPRPPELTGPDPAAYAAKLSEFGLALADQARGGACPAATVTSNLGAPLSDADLARERLGRPGGSGAVWREHLDIAGCGGVQHVRLYMARTGQTWGAVPLQPGDGRAGYLLGRDAAVMAAAAAMTQTPRLTCAADEMKRTLRVESTTPTSPAASGQPWTERWTFNICGRERPVSVTFTPDPVGGGTSISAKGG